MATAVRHSSEAISPGPILARGARSLRRAQAGGLAYLGVDVYMLLLAVFAIMLSESLNGARGPTVAWAAAFVGVAVGLYASRSLYRQRLHLNVLDDLGQVAGATTFAATAILSVRVIVGDPVPVALDSLRLAALAGACVAAGRVALYASQHRARSRGEGLLPTLIVGAGRVGCVVAKRLLSTPELGLRPVAFLDLEPLVDTQQQLGLPTVGSEGDLDEALTRYGIEQVIVAFSRGPDELLLRLVQRCEELNIQVSLIPRLYERMPETHSIDHLGGIPLVSPRRADPRAWQFRVKYALDPILAGVALLLLIPALVAISLTLVVTMGRPILFRQTRVGRDGRSFEMLKFRSMRRQVGEHVLPLHAVSADVLGPGGVEGEDRRTRVGTVLRRFSLDELPQLINVLRGEMSLIGPRPERPEYVSEFRQVVYRYNDRHRVKAGITGLAQVHGLRGHTSLADRAEWDNFYIENCSLGRDFKIALMTIGVVFGSSRSVE